MATLPPYECPQIIGFSIASFKQKFLIILATSTTDKGIPISLLPKPGKSSA